MDGKVYRFTHEDARRAEEFVDTHGTETVGMRMHWRCLQMSF